MMMKKLIAGSFIAASLGSVALPAAAAIYVDIAPPAPRHEFVPAPRHGFVWAPGYWEWRHHQHVWVEGHWVRERPGYAYAPARWVERDGRYYYSEPAWSRHRDSDGDGVPDRYDNAPYNGRYR